MGSDLIQNRMQKAVMWVFFFFYEKTVANLYTPQTGGGDVIWINYLVLFDLTKKLPPEGVSSPISHPSMSTS